MYKLKKLAILSIAFSLSIHASDDVQLHQQYQAPQELANLLDEIYEQDQNFRKCLNGRYSVCECPKGLACYIKMNQVMNRLKGWEQAKHTIADKNLDEIMLPQKYLWRGVLVTEKLKPDQNDNTLDGITKEQLSQLILFAKKGRFGDFIGGRAFGTNNVFFTKDRSGKQFWRHDVSSVEDHERKIAFIDTKYFAHKDGVGELKMLWKLFSKNRTDQCHTANMYKNGDIDLDYRPNNFESFWEKYKECFQKKES